MNSKTERGRVYTVIDDEMISPTKSLTIVLNEKNNSIGTLKDGRKVMFICGHWCYFPQKVAGIRRN